MVGAVSGVLRSNSELTPCRKTEEASDLPDVYRTERRRLYVVSIMAQDKLPAASVMPDSDFVDDLPLQSSRCDALHH